MKDARKVSDEEIKEILLYSTLTCSMIAKLCGTSLYQAKKIRKDVLNHFCGDFPYSHSAQVRTEHFLIYYNSPRLFKLYHDLYGVDLKPRKSQ